jgi:hypothetical protein
MRFVPKFTDWRRRRDSFRQAYDRIDSHFHLGGGQRKEHVQPFSLKLVEVLKMLQLHFASHLLLMSSSSYFDGGFPPTVGGRSAPERQEGMYSLAQKFYLVKYSG